MNQVLDNSLNALMLPIVMTDLRFGVLIPYLDAQRSKLRSVHCIARNKQSRLCFYFLLLERIFYVIVKVASDCGYEQSGE